MASTPERPTGLQFETAVPQAGAGAPAGLVCLGCQRAIEGEYFDVNGNTVCAGCRSALAGHAETPRGWGVTARAAALGLLAAVLGAVLYYAVIAITHLQIGIVAIAIGYMVGYAVRMGTGGRGGRRFQVMALVLTYWAVGLAYAPIAFKASRAGVQEARSTDATVTVTAEPDPRPAPPAALVPALLVVLVLTFALPVLMVVGSLPGGLISAAIIGFGMRQAWLMTGTPRLQISGPYRIGGSLPGPAGSIL